MTYIEDIHWLFLKFFPNCFRPDFADVGGSDSSGSEADREDDKQNKRRNRVSVFEKEDEKPDISQLDSAASNDARWKRLQQFKEEKGDGERDFDKESRFESWFCWHGYGLHSRGYRAISF